MENTDAKIGTAPSAVQEQANPYASGKLTREMSQAWSEGKEFKPQSAAPVAADSQEQAVASEEKSKSASAPEAGKETQEKNTRRKPGAEERISELIADKKRLEQELAEARKPKTTQAESSTAKATETAKEQPKKLEAPKKPVLEEFVKQGKTIEDYDAAMDEYHEKNTEYKIQKALEEDRQKQALESAKRKAKEEWDAAAKRYPDLKDVVVPFANELNYANQLVQAALNRSDVLHDLLYVIASKPEDRAAFLKEAKEDPLAAIERIAVTQRLIREQLSGKSKEKSEAEPKEKKEPPAKTKTEELQATREVGNRGSGPGDPAADAVRRSSGKLTKELNAAWSAKAAKRFGN